MQTPRGRRGASRPGTPSRPGAPGRCAVGRTPASTAASRSAPEGTATQGAGLLLARLPLPHPLLSWKSVLLTQRPRGRAETTAPPRPVGTAAGARARPRAQGRPRRVPREWPDRKHRTPGSHGRVAFSSPACGWRPFPAEGPAHLRGRSATSGQSHSHAFPPAPPLAPEIKPGFSAAAAPSFTPATSPVATQDTATRPRRPVRRLPRSAHRGSPAPACPAGGNAAGSLDDDGGSCEAAADAPAAAPGWALLGPTVAPDGQEPQGTHRPRRPSPACPAAGA